MGTDAVPGDERARAAGIRARLADLVDASPSPAELALVLRLLRSFTARAPLAVAELVHLLHENDADRVRDHAHGLKGMAANIGAGPLAALCGQIEDQARAGDVPLPGKAAERLRAEVGGALRVVRLLTGEYERIAG